LPKKYTYLLDLLVVAIKSLVRSTNLTSAGAKPSGERIKGRRGVNAEIEKRAREGLGHESVLGFHRLLSDAFLMRG
jgi:hypothetical protein